MKTYIARGDQDFGIQIDIFCNGIDNYSGLLNLNAGKITQFKTDRINFHYVFTGVNQYEQYASGVVGTKNLLRNGKDETVLININQPPEWPLPVPIDMKSGVEMRFADLIQDCVNSKKFTRPIGEFLGIIKPESPFIPKEGKPIAVVQLGDGGLPKLGATKGKYQGYSVYKDSGNGFKYYDKSIHHHYLDQREALPAVGVSKTWKYKLIYLYKDKEVGSFSEVVSIVVVGNI